MPTNQGSLFLSKSRWLTTCQHGTGQGPGAELRATNPSGCMAASLTGATDNLAVPGRKDKYLRGRRFRLKEWRLGRFESDTLGQRAERGGGRQPEKEEAEWQEG